MTSDQVPAGICACAQMGANKVTYVRRGQGPTLVFLDESGEHESLRAHLASEFCVISPRDIRASGMSGGDGLRAFIEALGLVRLAVVVHGSLAEGALDLNEADGLLAIAIFCGQQCCCTTEAVRRIQSRRIAGDPVTLLHHCGRPEGPQTVECLRALVR